MEAAQKTFISSTFWTERMGPTAALATIKKIQAQNVPAHLREIGAQIGAGWKRLADKHGLAITVLGPEALITFSFDYGERSQAMRTLFTQEMLRLGYLATYSVYVSFSHTEAAVAAYLTAVDEVFSIIAAALADNTVEAKLEGPVAHQGFKRLT